MFPLNPVPAEFLSDTGGALYVRFIFSGGREVILPYADIVHLRRKFNGKMCIRDSPRGWLLSQLWQGITPPSGATAILLRQAPQLGTRVRPRARSVSSFSQPGLVKSSSISLSLIHI